MKTAKVILISFALLIFLAYFALFTNTGGGLIESLDNWRKGDPPIPTINEVVMPADTTIVATTKAGAITIKSGRGLKRYYSWDGATRSVVMWPRPGRWYGSFGMYYPGPGFHWIGHNGIKRGVLDEGQQHFNTVDEAVAWLKLPYHEDCVYRDDGLVVCYSKRPERYQLNVDVWQIYVEGKATSEYKESAGDRIWAYDEKAKPEIFKNSKSTTYYVGGHKPSKLPGSNNDAIHTSWDVQK